MEFTQARLKYQFRCVIAQGEDTLTTDPVRLIIAEQTVFAIVTPPVDFEGELGAEASFHVEATGTELTYQWQYSSNGTKWYNSTLTGNKTDTLSMEFTEARLAYQYRCKITQGEEILYTDPVRLIKLEAAPVFEIVTAPVDYVGELGSEASFHVEATGTDLTYQWQYSSNGTKWYNSTLAGGKTDTLTMEFTQARLKYQFRCVVTQGEETLTTDPVQLILLA